MKGVTSVTVSVPLTIRRRGGRKQIIGPDGAVARQGDSGAGVVPVRGDPALIKALARGFRWRRMLEEGRYGSISEMAKAEGVERGYLGRLIKLTLLCPDIVEGILDGKYSEPIGLPDVMRSLPTEWGAQRAGIDRCDAAASSSNPPSEHEQPPPGICYGL
jgi:hypothetical protein